MVCVMCMWGVGIGLLQVVPSFANWCTIPLTKIPVCAIISLYCYVVFVP
jgi:hypothetical protein